MSFLRLEWLLAGIVVYVVIYHCSYESITVVIVYYWGIHWVEDENTVRRKPMLFRFLTSPFHWFCNLIKGGDGLARNEAHFPRRSQECPLNAGAPLYLRPSDKKIVGAF